MTVTRSRPGRAFLVVLATLLLSVVVAACGGDDEGEAGGGGAAVKPGKATGEITVWAPGVEGEKLPALAKKFEQQNPGTKVRVTAIPIDAAHDKILTSIAGQKTPDVSWVGTTWMAEFAKTGGLDETPSSIDQSVFFPGARDSTMVDGKAYGVPWHVETRLLYYRKDIAKKAGITGAPKTWDELKTMAQAMKEKGGARYGIGLSSNNWQEWVPFVWQNGGEVLKGEEFQLDSPQSTEATAFYQSFFTEKLAPPNTPQGFDITQGFVRGTHPMFFSGPWHMGLIKEQGGKDFDDKWAIAQMPEKESNTSFVGGGNLVVFKQSKNRDAAWKFVQFLTEPETQAEFYELSADLPSNQQAWELPAMQKDPMVKEFGEQLKAAKAPPAIPKWEQIATEINTQLDKGMTSGTPPQEVTKGFQQTAEELGTQ